MVECTYCGEESKYKPVVPKPSFFVHNNEIHHLVNISKTHDLICLECLDYELEEIKECY